MRGFTLIELVIIIATLGVLSSVAIPRIDTMIETSRVNTTRVEMARLKEALVGNTTLSSGGRPIDRGYLGDVGELPPTLAGLVSRPPGVPAWDPYLRSGWNGPYVDSTGGRYLEDAWGDDYDYDPVARTITSTGSGAPIELGF